MKHLNDRYAKVMEYKGMDICALRAATPSNGDEMGYKIDNILYGGMVFGSLGEAMEAVDSLAAHSAEEELKPCPFCGAQAISENDIPVEGLYAVCCENTECPVKPFAVGKTTQEAAKSWNTRN